jgi:hypothetical protein
VKCFAMNRASVRRSAPFWSKQTENVSRNRCGWPSGTSAKRRTQAIVWRGRFDARREFGFSAPEKEDGFDGDGREGPERDRRQADIERGAGFRAESLRAEEKGKDT